MDLDLQQHQRQLLGDITRESAIGDAEQLFPLHLRSAARARWRPNLAGEAEANEVFSLDEWLEREARPSSPEIRAPARPLFSSSSPSRSWRPGSRSSLYAWVCGLAVGRSWIR